MSGLGVSKSFTIEKNLAIILNHFHKDAQLTNMQVQYLGRFSWIQHKKGENYPNCQCLRCKALDLIREYKSRNDVGKFALLLDMNQKADLTFP